MASKKGIIKDVDCIAYGYEWSCPKCNALNHIRGFSEGQKCFFCGQKVKLNPPEHAYD